MLLKENRQLSQFIEIPSASCEMEKPFLAESGVWALGEEEITSALSPCQPAACTGQSHPLFPARAVLVMLNFASPQTVVPAKHS